MNYHDFDTLEEYVQAIADSNDFDRAWRLLSDGMTKGEIRQFKTEKAVEWRKAQNKLPQIVEEIESLAADEYLVINLNLIDWPMLWNSDKEAFDRRATEYNFLRTGKRFNLHNMNRKYKRWDCELERVTQNAMERNRWGFCEMAEMTIDSALQGEDGKRIDFNAFNYHSKIGRAGLVFRDTSQGLTWLRLDALMNGWRQAAAIDLGQVPVITSNPPGGFYCYMPSVDKGYSAPATGVSIQHLADSEDSDKNYSYWTRIKFDWFKTRGAKDIWSMHDRELGDVSCQEIRRQMIAAIILRNLRYHGSEHGRNIEGRNYRFVEVNVCLAPTPESIVLDDRLRNNVIIRYTDEKGNVKYKKPTDAIGEIVRAVKLWKDGYRGSFRVHRSGDFVNNMNWALCDYYSMLREQGYGPLMDKSFRFPELNVE